MCVCNNNNNKDELHTYYKRRSYTEIIQFIHFLHSFYPKSLRRMSIQNGTKTPLQKLGVRHLSGSNQPQPEHTHTHVITMRKLHFEYIQVGILFNKMNAFIVLLNNFKVQSRQCNNV